MKECIKLLHFPYEYSIMFQSTLLNYTNRKQKDYNGNLILNAGPVYFILMPQLFPIFINYSKVMSPLGITGLQLGLGICLQYQIDQIKLFLPYKSYSNKKYKAKVMSGKKKMSNGSLPTQTQNQRRFIRRNSIHTLNCRSGSLKKFANISQQLISSTPTLQTNPIVHNPENNHRMQTHTEHFFKELSQPYDVPLKRSSASMKIQHPCRENKGHHQHLAKQLQIRDQQLHVVTSQCKKLKISLNQQRQKRKILQEEVRCNQQEIKRLQKRLDKYRNEKDRYQKQRDIIIKHIEQLQNIKIDSSTNTIQTYRLKIMEQQVSRLRIQLQKSRSTRQKQLLLQLQKHIQTKYALQSEIKTANIANNVLIKQLQQNEQQMEQIRQSVHRTVISSYQYIQLRERYRRMLIQFKELRAEMSILQKGNTSRSRLLEHTLLTISQSEDISYEI